MGFVKIGRRLRVLRHRAGLTQTELAKAVGASLRSVQGWEANETRVDTFKAEGLLKAVEALAMKAERKGKAR